ncbi:MAG TPA: biotin--[acetyl-CoA-carboxylase] ligase, partial [Cyclobacteriaceae bacterium]|nr:biotin--[acetyl-CoA-carboxylase] ligase [Cyclobacteriaceae bacterium]
VPECHSTNTALQALHDTSPQAEGTIFVADHQSAGRGQRGNSWEAEPGKNITFSVLLNPSFLAPADQFKLNMAVSLGVAHGLQNLVSAPVLLKWPNDIWLQERKVGGVLIENQIRGQQLSASIVGIGINVNQQQFQSPLATSLSVVAGNEFQLQEVLDAVVESLEGEYLRLRAGSAELKSRYMAKMYRMGESHRFIADGAPFEGTIRDIDEAGRICMDTMNGPRVFSFQQVKFII